MVLGSFTLLKLGKVEENLCIVVSFLVQLYSISKGELTVEELKDAATVKYPQMESFSNNYGALADKNSLPKKSKTDEVEAKIDDDGLLCCDG